MDKIDFTTHEEYALGDTHMTYDQIARAAGVTAARVRRDERLANVPRVQIAGRRGAPLALEYTGAVHTYIHEPPAVQDYTYRYPEHRTALIDQLLELWKRMPLNYAADRLGVRRPRAHQWMQKRGHGAPVQWSVRLRKEMAYARQQKAQAMRRAHKSKQQICDALSISTQTLRAYLDGAYDKPDPIEGRTPLWEQDPSEHGLW